MSFDRVLPKPPTFHHEPAHVPVPRKTSNLLEHKIMNDDAAAAVNMDGDHHRDWASCRYAADMRPVDASPIASLNRAKIALNKIASSASVERSKPIVPLLTKDIPPRDRSSSSSPVKRSANDAVQFCLCQPDPKIPRPRNAFILYRQHYQSAVVAQNPGLPNPEISKIIGEHWRALPGDTKDEWKALAEEEKARHQQQYPDYRYQPRRFGRDGGPRGGSGLGHHNSTGSSVCNRCGGRIMNAPGSPETPFTPNGSGPASAHPNMAISRSFACRQMDSPQAPSPIKVGSAVEPRSRQRQWDESTARFPEAKRRRFNQQPAFRVNMQQLDNGNSPDSPHPMSPYTPRSDGSHSRVVSQAFHPARAFRNGKESSPHDPSLKLPPLQTSAPPPPPTPRSQDSSSVEATVKTIPSLNKIKLLSKIAPPLSPSFRHATSHRRGAVIAVDGQDPAAVGAAVDYLNTALKKEEKYHVRVFEGPAICPSDERSESEDPVDYLDIFKKWQHVSNEIVSFVKSPSDDTKSTSDDGSSGISPKTITQTENLQIDSPAPSSENGVGATPSPARSNPSLLPIALVPPYQLTTTDTLACMMPIDDAYSPLDHWQWMASLWRGRVGPDITVYIRECEKEEMGRVGGNVVEVRLQDARAIVVRRAAGSSGLEEKILKRVGFELEDFLAQ